MLDDVSFEKSLTSNEEKASPPVQLSASPVKNVRLLGEGAFIKLSLSAQTLVYFSFKKKLLSRTCQQSSLVMPRVSSTVGLPFHQ